MSGEYKQLTKKMPSAYACVRTLSERFSLPITNFTGSCCRPPTIRPKAAADDDELPEPSDAERRESLWASLRRREEPRGTSLRHRRLSAQGRNTIDEESGRNLDDLGEWIVARGEKTEFYFN